MVGLKINIIILGGINMFHLHVHTHISNGKMLDSPSTVEQYCEMAKEIGLEGFCITEHG